MNWQESSLEDIYLETGKKLKKMRKSYQFSQKELALKSNLSRSTIQRMESGKSINLDSIIRIFRTYQILDRLPELFAANEVSPMEMYLNLNKNTK